MSKLTLGIVCGVVFGIIAVATMIPLDFPNSIGFVLGAINLSLPGWAQGLVIGLLLSLADAIITKAYSPILAIGALGGLIIGVIVQR